jgi:putative DNA primase/helicase
LTGTDYQANADCPIWLRFLDKVMDGNQRMISFLQRAVGYMLTADTSEQCLFFLHGNGKNGKTVFTSTVQSLLGDYASRTPTETIISKRGDSGIPNDIARLQGARMVLAAELPEGRNFNEPLIKDLTGQDTIVARFLRLEFFEFRPQFKLVMFGNHKPDIVGTDEGIWRRVRMIPFDVTISKEERDPKLAEKLVNELPGILNWAIQGCIEWQKSELGMPEEVEAATETYRSEMDAMATFISEMCVTTPTSYAGASELHAAFCKHAGEKITNRVFKQRMFERGFKQVRLNTGLEWTGIGLISTGEGE